MMMMMMVKVQMVTRKRRMMKIMRMIVCSEDSVHSIDSGLEESGHSNLEVKTSTITMIKMRNAFKVEGGGVDGELIYENTAVLKSNAYLTPVTTAIEKYQFGGHEEEDEDEDDDDAGGEKEEDEVEEEEEEEEDPKDSEGVAVPFPPLDLTSNSSSDGVERSSSKLWGVRSNGGANGLLGPQVNISPTDLPSSSS